MLEKINSPAQLKQLSLEQKNELAAEIREKIIRTVKENGGHLASNLGAVELTIALHSVLNCPEDKLIFDVGHQCYTHKLLTGRYGNFDSLRKKGGISGFTRPTESEYDLVASGHASDSISLALGFAKARDLKNESYNVVAVIGDGALTGGMSFEGLNDAGQNREKMLIVLNDNEMSISKNVGSMSKHLTHMRQSNVYRGIKQFLRKRLESLPRGGARLKRILTKLRDSLKTLLVNDTFFDSLDVEYLGPIDGHDIKEMERVFKTALKYDSPVVVHVVTSKGKGYEPAEKNPSIYHGVSPKSTDTNENIPKRVSAGKAAANWLSEKADSDGSIVCISAAMLSGTGLESFKQNHPDRCFDVGIAEEHAAAFAAGLALNGLKPYLALYSTFAQRAYDQININICLNTAPVRLLIDRSGLNGADGETHQGVYDTGLLLGIPNITVCAPSTVNELCDMLEMSLDCDLPMAIKYPRTLPPSVDADTKTRYGRWKKLTDGKGVAIVTYGRMVDEVKEAAELLKPYRIEPTLVNALFLKPMDETMLGDIINDYGIIFVIEDSVGAGSLGEAIAEKVASKTKVCCLHVPDKFIPAATVEEQLEECGLDAKSLASRIYKTMKDEGLCS